MKASDLFAKCLEAEGVEYIFGLPGEENIDLLDSLSRSKIKFVLTRHEQGAAFMADVYGRLTGKPGVCLSTLGPGATNLITGVANAHLDKVPIIAITGQAERGRLHKESHQNVDTIKLFSGITKYNQQVLSARTIPEVIRKGFDIATQEAPGGVHIQLPEDVAKEDVRGAPLERPARSEPCPPRHVYPKAAEFIKNARKPIILAGNGVIRSKAWEQLRAFVEKSNLPFVNTFMAKGILPYDHPRNLFSVGGKPYPQGLRPLHEADFVVAVGFDLVEYDPETWNKDQTRKILNIHSFPSETDMHFPIVMDLVGNIGSILEELTKHVEKRPTPEEHDIIRQRRLNEMESIPNEYERLPRRVMSTLTRDLPADSVVICDVGLHKVWFSRWFQPKKPAETIVYNGFASMGGSLPGGIAAKLAKPDHPVFVVTGDGGFLMNVQELETAKRLGTAFTVVVFNDQRFSLIEQKQIFENLAVTDISFTNPDFKLLAQSFGAKHYLATTEEEVDSHLKECMFSDDLNIIEIVQNVKMPSGK